MIFSIHAKRSRAPRLIVATNAACTHICDSLLELVVQHNSSRSRIYRIERIAFNGKPQATVRLDLAKTYSAS